MIRINKRLFGTILAIIMIATMLPAGTFTASAAGAATQSDYETGDIITFGSYPQTKVTDSSLIASLNAQTLGADGTVTYGGSRYKRVYFSQYTDDVGGTTTDPNETFQDDNGYYINNVYWFKYEPIQWRVLSNTNGELYVMAEKILASRAYNQVFTDITWENCTLRSWLNGEFFNTAFNSTEQAMIKTSNVVNEDNPRYGTDGGNNTRDKLFLLSFNEVMNTAYGFSSDNNDHPSREAQGSDYARSQGLYVDKYSSPFENSHWWLRSPGGSQYTANHVASGGAFDYYTTYVDRSSNGTRPAIKLNLTPDPLTSKIGSNCVIDSLCGFIYGLDPGITSLENYVDVAANYELEYIPKENGFGTGTVVNVICNTKGIEKGSILASYTIIIFGDTNGDSNINAIDADICSLVQNWMIEWDEYSDAAYLKAGDINADGRVDSVDADIITLYENWLVNIDQTTGLAM